MHYAVVVLQPPKKHRNEQSCYDVAALIADKLACLYRDGIPEKSAANHVRKYGCTIFFDGIEEAYKFENKLMAANIDNYFTICVIKVGNA